MKRNRKEAKKRSRTIRAWTQEQALAALPYLGSVMRSLREHRLEWQRLHNEGERLAKLPGRPGRDALIAHEEAVREARLAEDRFEETLEELHSLDVYCLDPVRGLAFIPFVHEDQLAWFLYELFDGETLRFWRLQTDPLETRRPIAEIGGEATAVA
jgi:hypothetical protein